MIIFLILNLKYKALNFTIFVDTNEIYLFLEILISENYLCNRIIF